MGDSMEVRNRLEQVEERGLGHKPGAKIDGYEARNDEEVLALTELNLSGEIEAYLLCQVQATVEGMFGDDSQLSKDVHANFVQRRGNKSATEYIVADVIASLGVWFDLVKRSDMSGPKTKHPDAGKTFESRTFSIACTPMVADDGRIVFRVEGIDNNGRAIQPTENVPRDEIYSQVIGHMCNVVADDVIDNNVIKGYKNY